MPTLVDSLVVSIGLDSSQFKRGSEETQKSLKDTQDAASRTAKEMEVGGDHAAQFFASIKNEALGLIGVLVGGAGLAAVVKNTTGSMAALGREARNLGVDPAELDAFEKAIARNGGSADAAKASFKGLTDQMAAWKLKGITPGALPDFSLLGITSNDTALMAAQKFADYAKAHAENAPRLNVIGHDIGLDQGSIDAILQINQTSSLAAQMALSKELGVTTKQMAEDAAKLETSFQKLEQAAGFAAAKLQALGSPAETGILDYITNGLLWLEGRIDKKEFEKRTGDPNDYSQWKVDPNAHSILGDWWRNNMPTWLGGGGSTPSAAAPSLPHPGTPAAAVMQQAHDFYRSKGLTEAQTAGMLAQIGAESGFDPNAVGDNGTSKGLFQYHGARLAGVQALYGDHPTTMQQLEYSWQELNTTERPTLDQLLLAKTAQQAGATATGFERPKDLLGEAQRRSDAASLYVNSIDNGDHPIARSPAAATATGFERPKDLLGEAQRRSDAASRYVNSIDNGGRPIARAPASASAPSNVTNNVTVNVTTAASDPRAVAREVNKALNSTISGSNRAQQ